MIITIEELNQLIKIDPKEWVEEFLRVMYKDDKDTDTENPR